jgi:hypothetical protein
MVLDRRVCRKGEVARGYRIGKVVRQYWILVISREQTCD